MSWKVESEDPDELATAAECGSAMEFMLAKARLEASGIECFGSDEHSARMSGSMAQMLGLRGIRLQVRRADLKDAQELLNSPATDEDEEQFGGEEES